MAQRKNLKTQTKPWISFDEYKELFGISFEGTIDIFNQIELGTRDSITSILNNAISYFEYGTIAKDFEDEEVMIKPTTLPESVDEIINGELLTHPYFNNNGVLELNPFYQTGVGEYALEEGNFLTEYQQYQLKKAQAYYIEARYSGWKPHFESKRDIKITNGAINNSQSAFEYVDEFDMLPKQTKMHLRAMNIMQTLKNNGFKFSVEPEDYVRWDNLWDQAVNLWIDYKFNGASLGLKTQADFNAKLLELFENVSIGLINTEIISLKNPSGELLEPQAAGSQQMHNEEMVSSMISVLERLDILEPIVDLNTSKNNQQDNRLSIIENELLSEGFDYSLINTSGNVSTITQVISPTITKDFDTDLVENIIDETNGELKTKFYANGILEVNYQFIAQEATGTLINLTIELYSLTQSLVLDTSNIIIDFNSINNFESGARMNLANIVENEEIQIRVRTNTDTINILDAKAVLRFQTLISKPETIYDYEIVSTSDVGGLTTLEDINNLNKIIKNIENNIETTEVLFEDNNNESAKLSIDDIDDLREYKQLILYIGETGNTIGSGTTETLIRTHTDFIRYRVGLHETQETAKITIATSLPYEITLLFDDTDLGQRILKIVGVR